VHISVAAEAVAYAEALGLDAGANNGIRSTIDIFIKDMGLVTQAARAKAYPTPLATAAEQLYLAGRRAGLGRADDSSVIHILRGTASAST
jgi:3-hydroxyisobutyrate dehydrogenase